MFCSEAYQKTFVYIFWAFLKAYILITFFTINYKISRIMQNFGHLIWWILISSCIGTVKGSGQCLWTLSTKSLDVGNKYGCYLVHTVINPNKIKCHLPKCLCILHAQWLALLWLCTVVKSFEIIMNITSSFHEYTDKLMLFVISVVAHCHRCVTL